MAQQWRILGLRGRDVTGNSTPEVDLTVWSGWPSPATPQKHSLGALTIDVPASNCHRRGHIVLPRETLFITAQRNALLARHVLWTCVCPSVCHNTVYFVRTAKLWMTHIQCRTLAQAITRNGAPNAGKVAKIGIFRQGIAPPPPDGSSTLVYLANESDGSQLLLYMPS